MTDRQGIMVMGHGTDSSILQKNIDLLDDERIDFFIHWDKKWAKPNLYSHSSNIYFIDHPIDVGWGTSSQMKAELLLFKKVLNNKAHYKMVHLISSVDGLLMDKKYFLDYFSNGLQYLAFVENPQNISQSTLERVKYYWPEKSIRKHARIYSIIIRKLNKLFAVNRLKENKLKIYKGSPYFSLSPEYLEQVLNSDLKPFDHAFCVDEVFMQTTLADKLFDRSQGNARYIDWTRGTPYTFTENDVNELISVKNTRYAFFRKAANVKVLEKIWS